MASVVQNYGGVHPYGFYCIVVEIVTVESLVEKIHIVHKHTLCFDGKY